ncbi:MAG: hypothetical protein AEth_01368 [Candidatus Argoarchaeum ethanivorans]|uniref:Metanogen output domain-containing protein n=1 Tax=Candidatus Argoarchaeum ethanivorans TaxID=2608793 RepID=A0A8B3S1V7_9EURY|nr:MAG: hypothetical protein AEth_01368 [Candidatus Argoarchaeum ethanivorans]
MLEHNSFDTQQNNTHSNLEHAVENGYLKPVDEVIELLREVIDVLEEINGIDATEELLYDIGKSRGKCIGKLLGTGKHPKTAIEEFIEHVKHCYSIEVIDQKDTEKKYTAKLQINECIIKKLCGGWSEPMRNLHCRNINGLFEGALSFMTKMSVTALLSADEDVCHITMVFNNNNNNNNKRNHIIH